jgi:hypothetical protein
MSPADIRARYRFNSAADPRQLADGLLLLIEGAYAISQNLGGRNGPGNAIVWAANALVERATGGG